MIWLLWVIFSLEKFVSFGSLITQHALKIKLQYNGTNYMAMNTHNYKGLLQCCA